MALLNFLFLSCFMLDIKARGIIFLFLSVVLFKAS